MESLLEPIFRRLRIQKIKKYIARDAVICDIGCGFDGKFLKLIHSRIKKGIGLDKKANNFKDSKIELKNITILDKLDLPTNKFDIVTLLAVLEHLYFPEKILKESYRILKKNGIILITTPTSKSEKLLNLLVNLRLLNKEEIKDHKNYFTPEQLKKLFKKCNFKEMIFEKFEFGFNLFSIAKK